MLTVLRRFGAVLARLPRWLGVLAAACWMGFLWWLSSDTRDAGLGGLGSYVPNLGHALLYAVLALCWLTAWPRLGNLPHLGGRTWVALAPASCLALTMLSVAYGLLDEWHQASVPGRDASPGDLLTDMAGAGATVAVARYAGSSDATEGGMWRVLGMGVVACLLAAAIATTL